jgi:hypothetical protein
VLKNACRSLGWMTNAQSTDVFPFITHVFIAHSQLQEGTTVEVPYWLAVAWMNNDTFDIADAQFTQFHGNTMRNNLQAVCLFGSRIQLLNF